MRDIEETEQYEGGAEENSQGDAGSELSGDQMPDGESSNQQYEGHSARSGERVEAGIADQGQTSEEMGDEEGEEEPEEGEQTPPGLGQAQGFVKAVQ